MQKLLVVIIILFNSGYFSLCQQTSKNPDELFYRARQLAFNKQLNEARDTARLILQINEHYQDARILIGRTYAWENKYDSARFEINKVIKVDSSYRDAIDALADIEFWSGNFVKGLFLDSNVIGRWTGTAALRSGFWLCLLITSLKSVACDR